MRAVLMSMKPEWWEKILSGEKTLEIRKSAPQSKDGRAFRWPLTVLVYVSGTAKDQQIPQQPNRAGHAIRGRPPFRQPKGGPAL